MGKEKLQRLFLNFGEDMGANRVNKPGAHPLMDIIHDASHQPHEQQRGNQVNSNQVQGMQVRGLDALVNDHFKQQWRKQRKADACDKVAGDINKDDYPDFSALAAKAVVTGAADRAVIICGSGVGASIAANKLKGIRAGLCHDTYSAHQGVEHDDMNVIVLGSRIIGSSLAEDVVKAFLGAKFSGEARHLRRLEKVKVLDAR